MHRPIARRADGTEIVAISTKNPLEKASPNVLLFKHCYFPRKLFSTAQTKTSTITKSQSLSPPIEQYDKNQLFDLLDHLENQCSIIDFTTMLDQLNASSIPTQQVDDIEYTEKEYDFTIPNLFDQFSSLHNYFTTLTFDIEDSRKISIYTMTLSTVQLSPSNLFPYSILNGRRPLLQCSTHTDFKRIRSKQDKDIYQVTAIESSANIKDVKENDIILKVRL